MPRLLDMGIEPFLINSCLVLVLAQRLVRKACEHCREPFEMTAEQQFAMFAKILDKNPITFYKTKGCEICYNTGYRGRIGIYEAMTFNNEIRTLIAQKSEPHELKRVAVSNGMMTLFDSGINLAKKGLTTLDEIIKVAGTA